MRLFNSFLALLVFLALSASRAEAQWAPTNGPNGGSVWSLAVSDSNLFAGTDYGVFLFTKNDTSWTNADSGLPLADDQVQCLAVSGTNLFAGAVGVFLSTNKGASWNLSGLTDAIVWSLAVSDTNLFAGTDDGVFLSTNNGASWTQAGLQPGVTQTSVFCLVASDTDLFAGTGFGVFLSTNNGASWTEADSGLSSVSSTPEVQSLVVSGGNVFAGTDDGVFLSTNNGASWGQAGLILTSVSSFAVIGTNVFAGTDGGVFLSTNKGASWSSVGLTDTSVFSLAARSTNLFAGTGDDGVWRRPLSEMITAVKNENSQLPSRFALDQNYPNPFNPSTIIRYQLPTSALVVLKVFDVLGRQVGTLVDKAQSAGLHSIRFDGANLPSGLYFYRLKAGAYHDTKKMLLLK